MRPPVSVGDYTDFYLSMEHARNVGTMFRGADQALMDNWTCLPVGYHGRASTVAVSGAAHPRRPWGQVARPDSGDAPTFQPTAQLDYELELGCVLAWPGPKEFLPPARTTDGRIVLRPPPRLACSYIFGGPGNGVGEQIPLSQAEERVFGCVLVNDWSARDHQVAFFF